MNDKNNTYLLLLAAALIWGIQPLFIKFLVQDWSPVMITCGRYFLLSAIVFVLLYLRRDPSLVLPQNCWLPILFMGLSLLINNVAQFTGLQSSTVTNCTLISATTPALTALMAAVFLRERLNIFAWLGILLSFIGVLTIISHGSLSIIVGIDFAHGDILFFLSQASWTIYSLLSVRVMKRISVMAVTAWSGLSVALFTLLYSFLTGQITAPSLAPISIAAFFYTVVFGGVLAQMFWNDGVKNAGPSLTAIFMNIMPIVGIIGGVLLFGEVVGFMEIGGALAIFAGVYLTTHSEKLGRAKNILRSNAINLKFK